MSGAMYSGDPQIVSVICSSEKPHLLIPKSAMYKCPLMSTRIFSGWVGKYLLSSLGTEFYGCADTTSIESVRRNTVARTTQTAPLASDDRTVLRQDRTPRWSSGDGLIKRSSGIWQCKGCPWAPSLSFSLAKCLKIFCSQIWTVFRSAWWRTASLTSCSSPDRPILPTLCPDTSNTRTNRCLFFMLRIHGSKLLLG